MLKLTEHEKLWGTLFNLKSPNFKIVLKLGWADPPIIFYYQILRIDGPADCS